MKSNFFLSVDCIRLPLQAFKIFIKVIVHYVIIKQYSFSQNKRDFVVIVLHCFTFMSLFLESLSISVSCVSSQFSRNPSNHEHFFKVCCSFAYCSLGVCTPFSVIYRSGGSEGSKEECAWFQGLSTGI